MPASDDLTLAHALADTADAIATRYFQQRHLDVQTKADGSPVTEADLLIEAALREQLLRHRPGDTFVGEESGIHGHGGRRWFVDPIDGTTAFLAGQPDWRVLIAVEDAGTIAMGLASSPALRRRWWATRAGAAWTRYHGGVPDAEAAPLAVTSTARLEQATVAVWPVVARLPEHLRTPATRLTACCGSFRPQERADGPPSATPSADTGTRHGALLVATGELDAFLLAGAGPWDLAAMVPIVEEAGGRFSDVTGGRALDAAAAIFTNGMLHDQVLHCLRRASTTGATSAG